MPRFPCPAALHPCFGLEAVAGNEPRSRSPRVLHTSKNRSLRYGEFHARVDRWGTLAQPWKEALQISEAGPANAQPSLSIRKSQGLYQECWPGETPCFS